MLTLQRQHNDQLRHYVCQLRYARLIEPQKVVQDVDIDEDGMGCVLTLHLLGIPAADGIELNEERRRCLSVGVEEDVLEECPHEVQVVEAEARSVRLFGEEENDLPEIVSDEGLVRVPTEASEGNRISFWRSRKYSCL